MTDREALIERAARADHQRGLDCGAEYCTWDQLPRFVQDQYRRSVETILSVAAETVPAFGTVWDAR